MIQNSYFHFSRQFFLTFLYVLYYLLHCILFQIHIFLLAWISFDMLYVDAFIDETISLVLHLYVILSGISVRAIGLLSIKYILFLQQMLFLSLFSSSLPYICCVIIIYFFIHSISYKLFFVYIGTVFVFLSTIFVYRPY